MSEGLRLSDRSLATPTDSVSPIKLLPPDSASNPWRVAVVDDDPSIRRALFRMLTTNNCTVNVFASADEFLRSLEGPTPEVLVADLCLPDVDGLALQTMIRGRGHRFPIVFLSGHGDVRTSVQAVRDGAVDFLEKPCDEDTLMHSLAYAVSVARRDRNRESALGELSAAYRSLTIRERDVFRWVVSGRLNKQIAIEIGTVEKTVKVHRARVMTKMRAESLADLVRKFDALSNAGLLPLLGEHTVGVDRRPMLASRSGHSERFAKS